MKYPFSESATLELKETIPQKDQIIKTVIGFCNGYGGQIIIGVANDGSLLGVPEESIETILESIESAILQACEPPILVRTSVQRPIESVALLCIEVGAGMSKPYFRKGEGRDKGTYVRVGRSTVRATPKIIEELEWQARGIEYESTPVYRATVEELDAARLAGFFSSRRAKIALEPSTAVLASYRLTSQEQLAVYPSVAGILLFGREPQRYLVEAEIICSHFRGTEGRDSISTIDCRGTLFEQFQASYNFLLSRLGIAYQWQGPRRIDTLEIPEEALREGILNALVHRNYHIQAPTKIALFDDRVEIFSPGSFPGPLVSEELPNGVSYLRNPAICRVFREAGLIEKLGTGFTTIFAAAKANNLKKPVVVDGGDYIKLILFRVPGTEEQLTPDDEKILSLLAEAKSIKVPQVQKLLGVSRSTASRRLDSLVERGVLERRGMTRSLRYALKSHS